MRKFIFVGEKRSNRAIALGVTWTDGSLAAKQLFDALRANKIDPSNHLYTNWFEYGGKVRVQQAIVSGCIVVALGQKVARALTRRNIPHKAFIHPAARGRIRKKRRYFAHVSKILRAMHP